MTLHKTRPMKDIKMYQMALNNSTKTCTRLDLQIRKKTKASTTDAQNYQKKIEISWGKT